MASPDEIWLTDFGTPYPGEPAHLRPALVVGPAEIFGKSLPFVLVVPLTSVRRNLALHIEIEPTTQNGLQDTSYVQCELIRAINRRRLVTRLGSIGAAGSHDVHQVVRALLGH